MRAEVEEAAVIEEQKGPGAKPTTGERVWREVVSWFWVILAFLFIEGTLVQARVIPSGSMEKTVLIGDHLIVSRIGYDAGIPFTPWHVPLWRNPKRQQIIVFRAPLPTGLLRISSSASSACRATTSRSWPGRCS